MNTTILRVFFGILVATIFVIANTSYIRFVNMTSYRNDTGWFHQYIHNLINLTVQTWAATPKQVFQSNSTYEDFAALHVDKPEPPVVNKSGRYVSLCAGNFDTRRFGNQLFNFASMVKIASVTGRRVAMVRKHPYGWLDQIFDIPITRVENIQQELCPCVHIGESSPSSVAERKDIAGKSLLLCGYWQKLSYTAGIEMQLRYYLRFRPDIVDGVNNYFKETHPHHWPKSASPFRVGIHVRAGDIMNGGKLGFGHNIPKPPYFQKAMEYVMKEVARRSRTTSEKLLVHFYVTSDSIEWVSSTFGLTAIATNLVNSSMNEDVHITYSRKNTAAVDFALLSRTDALIISTGSYGWWAGWLANKTTVYYSDWPRPGSPCRGHYDLNDYFPPSWVPFSGPYFSF